MIEIAAALNSTYVIEASVDDEASEILVVARVVDARPIARYGYRTTAAPGKTCAASRSASRSTISAEIVKRAGR